MKKKGKKIITTIVGIIIAVVGILGMALNLKAEDTSGKLTLNKTAVATSDRKAKVTLEIQTSKLKQPTADIVIVMDHSSSMSYCAETSNSNSNGKIGGGHQPGGPGEPGDKPSEPTQCDSRLDVAKESAKDLAEELLPDNGNNNVKIGIVIFGTNYESANSTTKYSDMTSSLSTIKNKIDSIEEIYNNGTNVQAGLNAAKNLLKDSTADTKIIILISDGKPTYFNLSDGSSCGTGSSDSLGYDASEACINSGLIPSTAAEKVAKEIKDNPINAESMQ